MSFLTNPATVRPHVALIIETSNEYARGLLRGIKAYVREHRPWLLYFGEYSRSNTDLSTFRNWNGNGIIARIENPAIARFVNESGLPCVDVSAFRLNPHLPCVETNDASIARLAFEHFCERGFQHFAFYGDSRFPWSAQRASYFKQAAQNNGFVCYSFDASENEDRLWNLERERIADWLRRLPKPIGIMACYDIRGQQLLEACRLAQVEVPDEVAVLGVDNDALLCELSEPSLSSVVPDAMKTGYEAAALLDRMMMGEHVPPDIHLIEPQGIIPRQSTDVLAIEDKMVSDAIRFIRNHACDDINVGDVLKAIPLSRRVLEKRFVQALGHTPHDEILRVKINRVKQLLAETKLPLSTISERVGFKHAEYMSVAFKRSTGLSPKTYRTRHQTDNRISPP